MSTDRDVDRIVRSWLEEGVTALPDRVLDNVLDRLPATRQRRPWWPARRWQELNTPLRITLAAAAVVVLALVGVSFIPRTGGVGGPLATPVPTASPTSTASPTPSASPTPVPTLPESGVLAPGPYRSDFMTFTLPGGWTAYQGWAALKSNSDPPNGMSVAPWRIAAVYNDPCHSLTTKAVSVGPTVNDLVIALVAQKRGSVVTPVDVTIDGFHGKLLDLVVPLGVNIAGCEQAGYYTWADTNGGFRYNQAPGQHDLLAILDVNGQTLVVNRCFYPANTAADRAELQAIVDSIRIQP